MLAPLPLGLTNVSKKVEEGAIAKGKKDVAAKIAKQYADSQARINALNLVDQRVAARGPLPGMPKLGPQPNMLASVAAPAVAPSENDPNRMMTPLGKSPPLTARDIQGDPAPANPGQGIGGPQGGPPPQDELAAIEAELKRREELQAIEAELQRRGGGTQQAPDAPLNTDAMINEAVAQYPGGYKGWMEQNKPAPAGQHYERDALAKGEQYYLAPDQAQGKPQEFGGNNSLELGVPFTSLRGSIPIGKREDPLNIQIADILDQGVSGIMDLATAQRDQSVKPLLKGVPFVGDIGSSNDPVGAFSRALGEPLIKAPSAALRDLPQALMDYLPPNQAGMAYNQTQNALSQAFQGNWQEAGKSAGNALFQGANAALGFAGMRAGGPKSGAPKPTVREPTVREAGKTLAATAVPNRVIRPQAVKAIERILGNSGVPSDRIASGLTKVIDLLKTGVDDGAVGSVRPPTVAQLLEREFGPEFPEVRQNIRTVLLERRLTRKRGDASPTIVRERVQEMRGSQVPFLEDAAAKNMGDNSRMATRAELETELKRMSEENYKPVLSQPVDAARAQKIQGVLTGPGMSELAAPMRQIAAAEGLDIEAMIAKRPLEAAHWMQHKARILSESQSGNKALAGAYNKLRDRILATIDDVKAPNGKTYKEIRKEWGDEAQIGQALDAGDNFGALARNPDKANQFVESINGMAPRQREAALQSVRDWILSKIRGGGEEAAARLGDLQSIAVLDTLDKLGPEGKSMADAIRSVRDEEIFLRDFYPKGESATITNREALADGPDIYSRGGAKQGSGGTLTADAALMASGMAHAPVMSMLKKAPDLYKGWRQPRVATREDMTRILTTRPGAPRNALAPEPKLPKGPPTGTLSPGGGPKGPPINSQALTPFEQTVLDGRNAGLSDREIAKRMGLDPDATPNFSDLPEVMRAGGADDAAIDKTIARTSNAMKNAPMSKDGVADPYLARMIEERYQSALKKTGGKGPPKPPKTNAPSPNSKAPRN